MQFDRQEEEEQQQQQHLLCKCVDLRLNFRDNSQIACSLIGALRTTTLLAWVILLAWVTVMGTARSDDILVLVMLNLLLKMFYLESARGF